MTIKVLISTKQQNGLYLIKEEKNVNIMYGQTDKNLKVLYTFCT